MDPWTPTVQNFVLDMKLTAQTAMASVKSLIEEGSWAVCVGPLKPNGMLISFEPLAFLRAHVGHVVAWSWDASLWKISCYCSCKLASQTNNYSALYGDRISTSLNWFKSRSCLMPCTHKKKFVSFIKSSICYEQSCFVLSSTAAAPWKHPFFWLPSGITLMLKFRDCLGFRVRCVPEWVASLTEMHMVFKPWMMVRSRATGVKATWP